MDRFWRRTTFIIKAMTSTDRPFNWESENFHLSPSQYLAAALPSSHTRRMEHDSEPRQRARAW